MEANPDIDEATELLVELSSTYSRGQTVSWCDIESLVGPRYENVGRQAIRKWRKILKRDHQIVTLCADSVGVRLLTDDQAASEIPNLRQKKAFRQLNKALSEVRCVDTTKLTDHQRRLLAAQQTNMELSRQAIRKSRKNATANVYESVRQYGTVS